MVQTGRENTPSNFPPPVVEKPLAGKEIVLQQSEENKIKHPDKAPLRKHPEKAP